MMRLQVQSGTDGGVGAPSVRRQRRANRGTRRGLWRFARPCRRQTDHRFRFGTDWELSGRYTFLTWRVGRCGSVRLCNRSSACSQSRTRPFSWSHLGCHGAGPPSLRCLFRRDARSRPKRISGRPMPNVSSEKGLVTN